MLDEHRNVGSCNFFYLIVLICNIKKDERKKEGRGFGWLPSSSFLYFCFRVFRFLNEFLSKFDRGLDQLLLGIFMESLEFLVIVNLMLNVNFWDLDFGNSLISF